MRRKLLLLPFLLGWSVSAAGQPFPKSFDAPLIEVIRGASGRVVQPGALERLELRVTDRNRAPLANQVVEITVGEGWGALLGAGGDGRVLQAATGGDGVVQAQLALSAKEGPFLVAARVLGTDAAASVAFTALADPPSTAVSADAASQAVRSGLLEGALEDENLRVHGPFLLTNRDQLHPAGGSNPSWLSVPRAVRTPHWFFWIDDVPRAEFSHPVRYVLLDADQAETPRVGLPAD